VKDRTGKKGLRRDGKKGRIAEVWTRACREKKVQEKRGNLYSYPIVNDKGRGGQTQRDVTEKK